MISMIHDYPSEFAPRLNKEIMNKTYDDSLVSYIVDSWKSLEVVKNIKFVGYEYSENEDEIDVNKYIFKREKKKKKKDKYDYKFIEDDRFGLLTVHLQITLREKNLETGEYFEHVYPIKKSMLLPIQDEDGYYYIHGKKYYLIYQLVEKSTYTSNSSVTLKSLMPIAIKRGIVEDKEITSDIFDDDDNINDNTKLHVQDELGNDYIIPVYSVFVFKKEIPVILFYLKDGFYSAMDFLGVAGAIDLVSEVPKKPDPENIYFNVAKAKASEMTKAKILKSNCFIKVNRELFNKYTYLQSIVGGILHVANSRSTIESFNDPKVWIKKISSTNNYEKGLDILNFFGRLLDETTKKTVRIHKYHRQDIYTLIRWMCQEFSTLRKKDNLSLDNKRLRCNEVIASLLTLEFSKRLNRIISLGEKATIDNYKDMFKFPGDILIQKMHTSGILRFNEAVNDMSFFSRFKYTSKGPNSMGGKNANNIGIRYRGIHPSFLGNVDIFVCGNSDPGTSGLLSPYSKMTSLYFDPSEEKDDFMYLFQKDLAKIEKEHNIQYISLNFDSKSDYYDALLSIENHIRNDFKVCGTSKKGQYEIIIEKETEGNESIDVTKAPPTTATKRSRKDSKRKKAEAEKKTEEAS